MPKVTSLRLSCHSWNNYGTCARGSSCKFVHGTDELQPLGACSEARRTHLVTSALEWLEGSTAELATGIDSAKIGATMQGMAKPQQKQGTSKSAAAGPVHGPLPGMESITPVHWSEEVHNWIVELEQQAAEKSQTLLKGQTNVHSMKLRTNLAGKFARGKDCTVPHSKDQLLPMVDLRNGSLCSDSEFRGCCAKGADCKFAHGKTNLGQPTLMQAPEEENMPMPNFKRL